MRTLHRDTRITADGQKFQNGMFTIPCRPEKHPVLGSVCPVLLCTCGVFIMRCNLPRADSSRNSLFRKHPGIANTDSMLHSLGRVAPAGWTLRSASRGGTTAIKLGATELETRVTAARLLGLSRNERSAGRPRGREASPGSPEYETGPRQGPDSCREPDEREVSVGLGI